MIGLQMVHIIGTSHETLPIEIQKKKDTLVNLLIAAYFGEIETAINYQAIVRNLDGHSGLMLRQFLEPEIEEEFGHAKQIAKRISILGFNVPSSAVFRDSEVSPAQKRLQTVAGSKDFHAIISAIKAAEREAMNLYVSIISLCEEFDLSTADVVTHILRDEEEHFLIMDRLSTSLR